MASKVFFQALVWASVVAAVCHSFVVSPTTAAAAAAANGAAAFRNRDVSLSAEEAGSVTVSYDKYDVVKVDLSGAFDPRCSVVNCPLLL